jgi:Fe-S-cluster containining protein
MATCRECITASNGCCIFPANWKLILLPSDIKRIQLLTGKDPAEFIDTSALDLSQHHCYTRECMEADPLWARIFNLWVQPTGIKNPCHFLTSEGCSLPYPSKPFLCRIYPLNFNVTSGQIDFNQETECRICEDKRSLKEVMDYFGDEIESVQTVFEAFKKDFIELLAHLGRPQMEPVHAL